MLDVWQLYRGGGGGMGGGPGFLPDAGGAMDQPTAMLKAFGVMSAAEARMRRKDDAS